jgi:hypothetical protein
MVGSRYRGIIYPNNFSQTKTNNMAKSSTLRTHRVKAAQTPQSDESTEEQQDPKVKANPLPDKPWMRRKNVELFNGDESIHIHSRDENSTCVYYYKHGKLFNSFTKRPEEMPQLIADLTSQGFK